MKYFSYDPEDGFDFHDTREEAIEAANGTIEMYREYAGDEDGGWSDDVENACWGIICETATEDRGEAINDYGDYNADYHLTDKNCGDVSTLTQRITELEEERETILKLYARHQNNAQGMCELLKSEDNQCTCGLSAITTNSKGES